jgi:hypothetical protein
VIKRAIFCIATCIIAVVPTPWVLRAHMSDLSIYIDQSRVDRKQADGVGLWIRWVYDSAVRTDRRDPGLTKRIEVHSLVRCSDGRVRPLSVDVYDPAGAPSPTMNSAPRTRCVRCLIRWCIAQCRRSARGSGTRQPP